MQERELFYNYIKKMEQLKSNQPSTDDVMVDEVYRKLLLLIKNKQKGVNENIDVETPQTQKEKEASRIRKLMKSSGEKPNSYSLLGISINATTDEVNKKWKELMAMFHPDRNPNNEEMLLISQMVTEARNEILNRRKRPIS